MKKFIVALGNGKIECVHKGVLDVLTLKEMVPYQCVTAACEDSISCSNCMCPLCMCCNKCPRKCKCRLGTET